MNREAHASLPEAALGLLINTTMDPENCCPGTR
jgi:hypothetical protein